MVIAIGGADATANKTGKVLQVFPARRSAIVQGMHLIKKHMRKSQDNPQGAIVEKESPVALSNLMLFCPRCKKGVKSRVERKAGQKAQRQCRACGHAFD